MDNLLKAMGLAGIDKSKVSRICKELDQAVEQFRQRPLQESYPYVWLDALYLKVRQNHRVVSLAMVIAIGVDEEGERHLLGFDLGGSEDEAFWLAFLRSLVERGLKRVQLVISDAHEGLKKALSQVFAGASWQPPSRYRGVSSALHAQSAGQDPSPGQEGCGCSDPPDLRPTQSPECRNPTSASGGKIGPHLP